MHAYIKHINAYMRAHTHTHRVVHYTEKCGLPTRVRKAESAGRVDADRREALRRENEEIWIGCVSGYAIAVDQVCIMYVYIYRYT
jgi:hypothetical protein